MAVPTTAAFSSPLPAPAASAVPVPRPAAASAVEAAPSPAFRLRFLPGVVDLYDLTSAPADVLAAAGVEAGLYWLPVPTQIAAVPGTCGIRAESGWTTQLILQHGYELPAQDARSASGIMLDAWIDVPAPFAAAPGPLLRSQPVIRNGRAGIRYMTPWESLVSAGPGRPARVVYDRARVGCWIAWLVRTGQIPAAHPAIVAERRSAASERVMRHSLELGLPADVRAARTDAAQTYASARTGAAEVSSGV
jgi:hypothetical protein